MQNTSAFTKILFVRDSQYLVQSVGGRNGESGSGATKANSPLCPPRLTVNQCNLTFARKRGATKGVYFAPTYGEVVEAPERAGVLA